MYYEERIIDGIMHWRNDPDGDWTPYTIQELSRCYENANANYNKLYILHQDCERLSPPVHDEEPRI